MIAPSLAASIAVIDNRDSFVFNLVRYLEELGAECTVFANEIEPERLAEFDGVMISPGPGAPKDAGNSVAIINWAFAQKMPLIGICLGMQAIAAAFGGSVVRAERLIHGGTSKIDHDGMGIFEGIPQHFNATRYHSLAVADLPPSLLVTAHSDDGEVMALRHESEEIVGVQFHPEAVLTEHGHQLLQNWLKSLKK
jgi:para-aminobenzoate synthetase component 2